MVDFNNIPAAGLLRTPLVYIETDPARAGSGVDGASPVLFVGNMLSTGTATAEELVRVVGSAASGLFGAGSQLAESIEAFRANNLSAEIWAVPYDDSGTGIQMQHVITLAGTATADGTIYLYVGGRKIETAVTSGDTSATVVAAIAADVTADTGASVTAGAVGSDLTLTSKHAAAFASQIDVQLNYRTASGGEELPAGITLSSSTQTVAGANNPDIGTLAGIIGSLRFDMIHHPYASSDQLDDLEAMLNHSTGRWSYSNAAYGHALTAYRDTVGNLGSLGNGRNDPHGGIIGMEPIPNQPWQVSAAAWGASFASLTNTPGNPLQTLELVGILPAPEADRFTPLQRNILLFDGIATLYTDAAGKVRIERLITTYQTDAFGSADDAYLDMVTNFQLMRFNRAHTSMAQSKLARKRLVDDDTFIPTGSSAVTPSTVKGLLITLYRDLEAEGIVENADLYAANLVVERPSGDPNRLDALLTPDVQNQLRVLALKNEFYLQLAA